MSTMAPVYSLRWHEGLCASSIDPGFGLSDDRRWAIEEEKREEEKSCGTGRGRKASGIPRLFRSLLSFLSLYSTESHVVGIV